jgi:hypothetical protein
MIALKEVAIQAGGVERRTKEEVTVQQHAVRNRPLS